MKSLTLNAYAKINLYLRVLGKGKDGYHELDTLFERVSLHDEIRLSPSRNGIELEIQGADLPSGSSNLAYRAAQQFKEGFGIKEGVRIKLTKRIPIAAGLGGGSSDAATVLLGLNRLWKVYAPLNQLMELGRGLGADVPFFLLQERWAIGTGRGDVLKPLSALPGSKRRIYLLATPNVTVLTKEVYAQWDRWTLTPLEVSDKTNRYDGWENDLLPVVLQKYPKVKAFAQQLKELGLSTRIQLSGSGPTFFTPMETLRLAQQWVRRVKGAIPKCQVFAIEGC